MHRRPNWQPPDSPYQDAAEKLAERVRGEVPTDSKVAVAGTFYEVEDDLPKPFAFLGGLGG